MKSGKLLAGLLVALAVIIGAHYFGSVDIPVAEVTAILYGNMTRADTAVRPVSQVLVELVRAPRILAGFAAGAVLATTGLVMQTLTRNPLAEPYVLGISAGASTGAVEAILLGWFSFLGGGGTYVAAFLGALLAMTCVLVLMGRRDNPVFLVLLGMGVNAFFGALTTMLIYSSNNEAQVRSAMFWLVGSLAGLQWSSAWLLGLTALLWVAIITLFHNDFDLLLLGRDAAARLGLSVRRLQWLFIVLSSLAIAVAVAHTGVIGFIGLIIPHMARRIIGPQHLSLGLLCALSGGTILVVADTAARTLFRPEELPIGVLTALIGAPLFVALIRRAYGGER